MMINSFVSKNKNVLYRYFYTERAKHIENSKKHIMSILLPVPLSS